MASVYNAKRLWTHYMDLRNWAASTFSTSKIFKLDNCSMQDSDDDTPSDSRSNNSVANQSTQFITITGLIYPSTEPFGGRGLRIELRVPYGYPHEPPEVYMKIQLRHPNIDKDGRICTVLLDAGKNYVQMSLADVLKIIVDLIDQPERGHVVDAEAGSCLDSNPEKYNQAISAAVEANEPRCS
ncbi:hypothetical protein I4U23_015149 [Adineta vaga]|nr:hypothetical protein I4U23_015149 [Adineta vaga]